MSELIKLSIKEAISKLNQKEISSHDLTIAHLNQMEKHKSLNCYITETTDIALQSARESDQRIHRGIARKLDGIPVAIKDLFCTHNIRTTSASRMLENFVPQYESTVSEKLYGSGAVMLGKTNMDEFAMGSTNITSHFGPVISPWKSENSNEDLVPGGSSGGSAAAVAQHQCIAALGSDTGGMPACSVQGLSFTISSQTGSIRQPASFCGVVGLKPTFGLLSRHGLMSYASSFDCIGPVTSSVEVPFFSLTSYSHF